MIRHVLLDADGVLQSVPGGWVAAVEPFVGAGALEFLEQTWSDELPELRPRAPGAADAARRPRRGAGAITRCRPQPRPVRVGA